MAVPKSLAIITCLGLSSVSAISYKTFLDPVMRVASNYLEGRSSGDSPVSEDTSENLSEAARFLFVNLTSTSTTISYTNALLLILGLSAAIFLAFLIAAAIAYLLASDLVNGIQDQSSTPEDEASNQEQYLDSTARFLFLNSSSTISASYALFIILAISFALFAGLMLIYLLAGSLFGTGLGGYKYRGTGHGYKRSLNDEMEEYNLTKIVEILALMEEEFRRVGGAWVNEEECKKRALCELTAKTGVFGNEESQKMARLVHDLQQATESSHLNPNVNHEPVLRKANSFIKASQKGHKEGECIRAYPKCST